MSNEAKPVNVTLLDKEYLVACHDDERESLFEAAAMLDSRMQDLRDSGKVIGSERVAVMAALNIAHEFLEYKLQNADYTEGVDTDIQRIKDKIEGALKVGRIFEKEVGKTEQLA